MSFDWSNLGKQNTGDAFDWSNLGKTQAPKELTFAEKVKQRLAQAESNAGIRLGNVDDAMQPMKDTATSLRGGVGETIKGAGSVASYLGGKVGKPELGKGLQEYGAKVAEKNYLEPVKWEGWRTLLNPAFYQRNVARTVPTTAALVVPAALTGGATAGLGTIAGAVTAGTLNRAMESAMEAGGVYEQAVAAGKSQKEADDAADKAFRDNMKLVGLDIGEFAAAFFPGIKATSTLGKAAVTAGRLALAGGQEAIEEGLQSKFETEALGGKFSWKAPSTQEAMAIGALMGVGLGGAGEVSRMATEIHKAAAQKLPDQQRLALNTAVAERMAQGKSWALASAEAMADLSKQNPAINAAVRDAKQEVMARYPQVAPDTRTFQEQAGTTIQGLPTMREVASESADFRDALVELRVGDKVRLQGDATEYTVVDNPRVWQVTIRDKQGVRQTVTKDEVIPEWDVLRDRLSARRVEEAAAKKPAKKGKKAAAPKAAAPQQAPQIIVPPPTKSTPPGKAGVTPIVAPAQQSATPSTKVASESTEKPVQPSSAPTQTIATPEIVAPRASQRTTAMEQGKFVGAGKVALGESAVEAMKGLTPKDAAVLETFKEVLPQAKAVSEELIQEELAYLQASMKKGVTPGGAIRDSEGYVIGHYPTVSHNERWYQDWMKTHKRPPNKAQLRELAIQRLERGGPVNSHEIGPNEEFLEAQQVIETVEKLDEKAKAPATPDLLKQKVAEMSQANSFQRAVDEKYPVGFAADTFKTIRDVIDAVRKKDDVRLSDADVEKVVTASRGAKTWLGGIVEAVGNIGDKFKDVFKYEWRVEDFPRFQDQLRRFQGVARDAQVYALETYLNIVTHLRTAKEFNVFKKMIVLEDLRVDLQQGNTVPGNLTLEQVQRAQAELQPEITDGVRTAIEAHNEVFKTAWKELQRRYKVSDTKEAREAYYPHKVMDYIRGFDTSFPVIGRKLQEPYRYYLKKRGGTARLIDTDYLTVTLNHLTKFYMDNAVDDFAMEIARDYDAFPKLTAEDKKRLHIDKVPQVGRRYDIGGKPHFGWQYLAKFANNPVLMELMNSTVQADDLAKTDTMKQEYRNIYILPQEIADRIARLRDPGINSVILQAARLSSWMWKNVVLGPLGAGIPFQINNFVGDVLNLVREDPAAVLLIPEGWKAATAFQKNQPGKYKDLLDIAEQTRVVQAGLMRSGGIPYHPHLATLERGRFFLRNANVFQMYQGWGERRELSVRLAKLMKDMERIKNKQSPQVKTFDVKPLEASGMKPVEIAGKVAREFGVDYGKLTQEQKAVLRDVLMPFSTFYLGNLSNWVSYVRRNPGEFAAKFVVPLIALAAWNNFTQPEKEKKLPAYYRAMPHLVTGYETPDGKPIIIAFQTPLDQAAKMFGLEITGDLAAQVIRGDKSIDDAVKELGQHVMGGAQVDAFKDLLNPFIKSAIEVYANRKMYNDAPIVDEDIRDTPEGKAALRGYLVQQWLTPVGQYAKTAKELATEGIPATLKEAVLKGPADLWRGLGRREVDVERESIGRFYDALDKLEGAYAVWKDKRDSGESPGAFKDLAKLRRLQAVARDFTPLWKVMDRIKVDKTRTQDERDMEVRKRLQSMARRVETVLK
jgi:hypothetical protein